MKRTYFIDHLQVGSINLGCRTRIKVEGTYQEAVDMTHQVWNTLEKKTLVTLHSDLHCVGYWHWIGAEGEVRDRNTGSNVKFQASYKTAIIDGAYRIAA